MILQTERTFICQGARNRKFRIMKILITGSSGFIGSHLTKAISENLPNIDLIGVDEKDGFDILNKNDLESLGIFDLVVHLAGRSYVPASYEVPFDLYNTNILGMLNILELCRKFNARMIFLSSYVYGKPEYLPVDESHRTMAFNPYCQSKLICESLCYGYYRDFKIPSIIFRPFNVYGAGQKEVFLIPNIFRQLMNSEKKVTLKDSEPKRDFIYVSDVVGAIVSAIKNSAYDFEIFNLCSGLSYSVREVTEIINGLLRRKVDFIFSENHDRVIEVSDTRGDRSKISDFYNWAPKYTIEMGLKELIDYYRLE
jgi:nucleoside-diphosphate-sugar epimerase